MKRITILLLSILGLAASTHIAPKMVLAQVSCPSSEMNCSEIDYRGGCQSPCIRVVTRQGQPGRGGIPALCQCQEPLNQPGSSPLKGDCIDTAIGCIPIEQQGMITFFLKWAIGIAGGIAFILIIIASFQIMTSQGDPKRLQAGKELLNSAIMGLILLIFSVFILRIIGVRILQIPGLS